MRGFATLIIDVLNEAKRRLGKKSGFVFSIQFLLYVFVITQFHVEKIPRVCHCKVIEKDSWFLEMRSRYYGVPLKGNAGDSVENILKGTSNSMDHLNVSSMGNSEYVFRVFSSGFSICFRSFEQNLMQSMFVSVPNNFLLSSELHVTDMLGHLVKKVIGIMMKLLIACGMENGAFQEVLGSLYCFVNFFPFNIFKIISF